MNANTASYSYKQFARMSYEMGKAEFSSRNQGTWLGILWYLFAPLLTFGLLLFIFQNRLGSDIPQYPFYLLLGIIMFNFFRSVTIESIGRVRMKSNLIKSVYFPREVIIAGMILRTLFAHMFEVIILLVFMVLFNVSIVYLIIYPVILFFLMLFTYGVALFLSALVVHIYDIEHIWTFLSQLLWFATPIFYQISTTDFLFKINLLNPMYYFITFARDVIIYNQLPPLFIIVGATLFALLSIFIGQITFSKLQKRFAELM